MHQALSTNLMAVSWGGGKVGNLHCLQIFLAFNLMIISKIYVIIIQRDTVDVKMFMGAYLHYCYTSMNQMLCH